MYFDKKFVKNKQRSFMINKFLCFTLYNSFYSGVLLSEQFKQPVNCFLYISKLFLHVALRLLHVVLRLHDFLYPCRQVPVCWARGERIILKVQVTLSILSSRRSIIVIELLRVAALSGVKVAIDREKTRSIEDLLSHRPTGKSSFNKP